MPVTQPLSDRELLERFREGHADVGSVHDIARVSEAEFVATYSPGLANGQREARRIHQMARCISETTALVWANLRDIAVPHLRTTLFNNVAQSFVEHSAAIPGYQALFGDLSVLECDDSESVFGPAAYFVDLMRFVEQHIDPKKVRSVHALPYRRPDLAQLELDAHNTYGLVPEIDLVIEALTSLAATGSATVDDVLRQARYPWVLPFDEPWERLRTDLGTLEASLSEVSELFGFAEADGDAARVREALGLSPAEYDLVVAPPASPTLVTRSYGGPSVAELTAVDLFLDRTGLSRAELTDLLSGPFDDTEIAAGLTRGMFINDADDGLGHLDIDVDTSDPQHPVETLVNLSAAKLDRVERFVRLSRRLGWSFSDLDSSFSSLRTDQAIETVLSFDGINDYSVVADTGGFPADSMTIECWVRPTEHRINPVFAKGAEGSGQATTDLLVWIDRDGRLAVQTGTAAGYSRSRRVVPAGTFSHVAVSISGGSKPELGFVINGEPEPVWRVEANEESLNGALPGPIGTAGTRLLFGRSFGGDAFFGAITDVRLWEGVRDPEMVAAQRFARLSGAERGLAGYWPLVRERWERLSDRSPGANHAVVGGPEFVTRPRWVRYDLALDALPPQVPALLSFDGREYHLAATEVGALAGETFTIELLVQQRSARAAPLIRWENDAGDALGLDIDDGGRLRLQGGPLSVTSAATLVPDVLAHVAIVVTPNEVAFAIDGLAAAARPNPGIRMGEDPVHMLVAHDGATAYFAGHIGEIRLWDRVRTTSEIDVARHRPAPSSAPGLVGLWAMSSDDSARVLDRSFNAHHLWLGGDPASYRPQPITAGPILPAGPIGNQADLPGQQR